MVNQLIAVVSLTCLAMVIPGPDMLLVLGNTVLAGRHAGFRTSLGVLSGNLVHITYCLLGIGWVISRSILAFSALKYAAAAYLIYLGVTSLRAGRTTLDVGAQERRRPELNWFLQGFVNNVLNPKGALFYLGVFTVVIAPGTSAGAMLLLVGSMMAVSASFWLLFVYTLDRPSIREWIARWQRTVSRVYGGLLIVLGVRVALSER